MLARPVVVLALVAGCLLGAAVVVPGAAADPIELENGLSPSDTDDRIDVETRLSIPDSTVELELTIPADTDVTAARGFERVDDRTYAWTGSTATPRLAYEYDATVRGSHRGREGVTFVANDGWAIVRTPSVGVSWRSTDTDSELARANVVDGEGVASAHMAYLGPYTEHTGSAAGQTFRLVVPEAADLREAPDEILAALEAAAERLVIGPRPDVFAVAAPTDGQSWGPAGVQRGPGGDFWVRDTERLGTTRNTWVHEYVHTRQRYAATDATRWTIEGMADYYAALLAYEAGDADYAAFRDRLERGTGPQYDGVRLADPGTWDDTTADYERGAQLLAHLDRRLRADAGTSLDAVVAGVNRPGRELTQRRFLDAVGSAGGADVRADAKRYTETTAAPPIASRSEHVAAFGGPDVRYSIAGTAVSGPYRTGAVDPPELVVGETLELDVVAENVGTEPGDFEAELRVDGGAVAVREGRLDPGASTTLRFARKFDSAGEFELSVGAEQVRITVEEPADIEVVGLETTPAAPSPGEAVTLRATVASAAERPAAGEVTFRVDGDPVATEPVRIGDGTATVETTVSFDEEGEYVVSAGGQRATVTVGGGAAPPAIDPPGIGDQPGFGAGIALLAVLAVFAARGRNEL